MPPPSGRRCTAQRTPISEGPLCTDMVRQFAQGSEKERRKTLSALRRIAPRVPRDFVLSTIGLIKGAELGTTRDLLAFDATYSLDWDKLHKLFTDSGLWVCGIEDEEPRRVYFSSHLLESLGATGVHPLNRWQRQGAPPPGRMTADDTSCTRDRRDGGGGASSSGRH